jgi:hypothetical protein
LSQQIAPRSKAVMPIDMHGGKSSARKLISGLSAAESVRTIP